LIESTGSSEPRRENTTNMDEMKECVSCRRHIDEVAKLCPYCGADPDTGTKVDATPIVQEHFPPRPPLNIFERLNLFLRQRQGLAVGIIAALAFLALWGLHRFASSRNASAAEDVPTVALTDIADLANQREVADAPLPTLQFSYDGNPKTMQTFLVEPGAVAPAPPPSLVARPQLPAGTPAGPPVAGTPMPSQILGRTLPQNPAPQQQRPAPAAVTPR
jgi:hypothetical protein